MSIRYLLSVLSAFVVLTCCRMYKVVIRATLGALRILILLDIE